MVEIVTIFRRSESTKYDDNSRTFVDSINKAPCVIYRVIPYKSTGRKDGCSGVSKSCV